MEYMGARMQDRCDALSKEPTQISDTRPIVAEQQGGGEDYKAWYDEAIEAANEAGYGQCTAAQAIRMLADELNLAEARVAEAELLRPFWAKGYTSDSIAAQSMSCALAEIWNILGVSNQTEAVGKLRSLVSS